MNLPRFLACALWMLVPPAWAEVLYDLTFEPPAHQAGQAPAIGAGPSKVSGIVFGAPKVVNNQPLLSGNCLEFEGYTSYEQIILNTGDARGVIQVDFDIVTQNVIGSLYGFTVFLDTPEVRSLTFHGPLQKIQAFMPFGGGMLQAFVDGRKYHVSMVADTVANRWTVFVDGAQQYQSVLNASAVSSIRLSMAPMYGMAADNPASKAYVDNFKVVKFSANGNVPLVTNLQATEILLRQAILSAAVNPQNSPTNVYFTIRHPSGFTQTTPTQSVPASGNFTNLIAFAQNLQPHTNYSYGVVATSAAGSASAEGSFTTANTVPFAPNVAFHPPGAVDPFTVLALAGQVDADGDFLTLRLVAPDEEGFDSRVSLVQGALTFTADEGFDGNATFNYGISDGFGGIGYGVITLTNSAPVARNLTLQVFAHDEAAVLVIPMQDADGDAVKVVAVGEASFGQVSFAGKSVTYVPGPSFLGSDQFSYTVSDGRGGSATGTVRVGLGAVQLNTQHATGSAVPGVPGAVWKSFGIPSIFAEGRAGWVAKIREGAATYDAIFSGPLGEPRRRLKTGDFVVNAAGKVDRNATFSSFEQPVFAGDNFAFKGRMSGRGIVTENCSGIWIDASGELRLIAREGSAAPGTTGTKFTRLESIVMPESGCLFFTATISDGSRGLWAWRKDAAVAGLLLVGQPVTDIITGGSLGRVASFEAISLVPGSAGHGRYDASTQSVDALVHFQSGRTAILVIHASGEIALVERTNQPEGAERRMFKLGHPSSPGNGRKPVALGEFTLQRMGDTRYRALFDFESDAPLVLPGASAPGFGSEKFVSFKNPVAGLSLTGDTLAVFQATIVGGPPGTNSGIWSATTSGQSALVARKGHPAPGADGFVFRDFKSLSVIDGHGAIFTASLAPGIDTGCWATDSTGELRLLLRAGSMIDGKTIRSFQILTAVPGTDGQRRAWALTGYGAIVIARAQFTDNTQGIVTVAIP